MSDRAIPRPKLFRAVLASLGVVQTVDGIWALVFPSSFYDDFPAGRGGWVSSLPPYSEHLMTDVGALFLATGVLMLAAAVLLERTLVVVSLVVWLLWAAPHTIWHMAHLGGMETFDEVANIVTLVLTVVPPAALLVLLLRRPGAAPRAAGTAPANGGARIRGIERPRGALLRYVYRQTARQFGHVVEPVKITAHTPRLLVGYGMFEMATERSHAMEGRLKELAVMRTAQLTGCEWCLDFGSAAGRAKGVSDDELRALVDWRSSDVLSDDDKLVLEYAEAMTRTPVDVPDELFERLRARFDEPQIVELTSTIALENYRARFNWALDIGSEGFSEGAYCVPPALAGNGAGARAGVT